MRVCVGVEIGGSERENTNALKAKLNKCIIHKSQECCEFFLKKEEVYLDDPSDQC